MCLDRDPATALENAEAIVVGGGNTFQLLAMLHDRELLGVIRARVHAGVPYIGWSAGAVIAAPTIGTTNDMPVVEPPAGFGASEDQSVTKSTLRPRRVSGEVR